MFDIPISLANKIYATSNLILVIGLVMALSGTIGTIWSGGIRNKFYDGRIAFNEAETASANERALNVEKDNLILKTKLEKEHIERLRLEQRVSPRRLTSEMQTEIADALSPFGSSKIIVKSYALDVESAVLGTQIISTLEAAKIGVFNNLLSQSALGSVGFMVRVTGKNAKLVETLRKLLSSVAGLAVSPEPIPKGTGLHLDFGNEAEMDAIIFVGAKPLQ